MSETNFEASLNCANLLQKTQDLLEEGSKVLASPVLSNTTLSTVHPVLPTVPSTHQLPYPIPYPYPSSPDASFTYNVHPLHSTTSPPTTNITDSLPIYPSTPPHPQLGMSNNNDIYHQQMNELNILHQTNLMAYQQHPYYGLFDPNHVPLPLPYSPYNQYRPYPIGGNEFIVPGYPRGLPSTNHNLPSTPTRGTNPDTYSNPLTKQPEYERNSYHISPDSPIETTPITNHIVPSSSSTTLSPPSSSSSSVFKQLQQSSDILNNNHTQDHNSKNREQGFDNDINKLINEMAGTNGLGKDQSQSSQNSLSDTATSNGNHNYNLTYQQQPHHQQQQEISYNSVDPHPPPTHLAIPPPLPMISYPIDPLFNNNHPLQNPDTERTLELARYLSIHYPSPPPHPSLLHLSPTSSNSKSNQHSSHIYTTHPPIYPGSYPSHLYYPENVYNPDLKHITTPPSTYPDPTSILSNSYNYNFQSMLSGHPPFTSYNKWLMSSGFENRSIQNSENTTAHNNEVIIRPANNGTSNYYQQHLQSHQMGNNLRLGNDNQESRSSQVIPSPEQIEQTGQMGRPTWPVSHRIHGLSAAAQKALDASALLASVSHSSRAYISRYLAVSETTSTTEYSTQYSATMTKHDNGVGSNNSVGLAINNSSNLPLTNGKEHTHSKDYRDSGTALHSSSLNSNYSQELKLPVSPYSPLGEGGAKWWLTSDDDDDNDDDE